MLINGREILGIKHEKVQKAFIDYSQTFGDSYENLEDYNLTKKRKVLMVFDDVKRDIEAHEKLIPIVTELLVRCRKLKISLVFISKSYFKVPKDIILNAKH